MVAHFIDIIDRCSKCLISGLMNGLIDKMGSQFIAENHLVDLKQDHGPGIFQFFGLDGEGIHNSLLFDQLQFDVVPLLLLVEKIVLEHIDFVLHIINSFAFVVYLVEGVLVLLLQFMDI